MNDYEIILITIIFLCNTGILCIVNSRPWIFITPRPIGIIILSLWASANAFGFGCVVRHSLEIIESKLGF